MARMRLRKLRSKKAAAYAAGASHLMDFSSCMTPGWRWHRKGVASDGKAIGSDWKAIGGDLGTAMKKAAGR